MRIKVVTTEYPPHLGGVATWTAAVAGALRGAGHEVQVFAHLGGGEGVNRLRGRHWNRWGHAWTATQVRPRLSAGDVVLASTWPLAVYFAPETPLAVAWHGSDLTRPPLIAGREKVAGRAVNFPVSRYLGSLLGERHTVLPYPIEPGPVARRGEALLVIARLGPLKGVDRAVRLAARLGRPLVVVGEGPERVRLQALAAELGVKADFRGATRDIPWDGTWALAMLSRPDTDGTGAEGLGLVMLEAAARGIASIGSACGGIPEAASVILADPEQDHVPPLPSSDEVRDWLVANHGTVRCIQAFEAAFDGLRA